MYTLYGSMSSRAFRVAWLLEEMGQPYELVPASPHSPEIKAVNPLGKVPALVDDDLTITDSTAILTYLADQHQAFTSPPGSADRALQDAMTHRLLDELEGPIWAISKHSFIFPEKHRVPQVVDAMKAEFTRSFDGFGGELRGDYLMGDELTLPDILLVHLMSWALFVKIPLSNAPLLAYSKRARARPAYAGLVQSIRAGG